jgi:hypothetical protein
MGLLDLFKKKKKRQQSVAGVPTTPKTDAPKADAPKTKSAKEIANENSEPYIGILSLEIDPENLHQGAFELDWNEKFVANLVRAGYQIRKDDTDADIVDRWFQTVCRHVVMETWEQEQAMAGRYIKERNLGNGRSEIS